MSLNLIHTFFSKSLSWQSVKFYAEVWGWWKRSQLEKQDKRGKTHSLAFQYGLRVFLSNFMDGLGVGYFFLSMIYFDRSDFVCKQRHLVAFWHESLRRPFRTGLVWNNQQIHQLWDQQNSIGYKWRDRGENILIWIHSLSNLLFWSWVCLIDSDKGTLLIKHQSKYYPSIMKPNTSGYCFYCCWGNQA